MSRERSLYEDRIEALRDKFYDQYSDEIEEILLKYGASEDDSDPYEGFYVTMTTDELIAAYNKIKALISSDDEVDYAEIAGQLTGLGFRKSGEDTSDGGNYEFFTKGKLAVVVMSEADARKIIRKYF